MMSFELIDTLKERAGSLAYSNFLYDWSLRGETPDRLIVRPVDPWPGDAEKAKGLLQAAGIEGRTGPMWYADWWSPVDADGIWVSHMHGFGWLRDLRTLGGALSREQGRVMIESWIDEYDHWNAQSWRDDLIGRRLAMWICHYDYFGANGNAEFEEKFLGSVLKQAKHLSNVIGRSKDIALLESVKGLLYAGIALEGRANWIAQGLTALKKATSAQILPDGGHISRSPQILLDALEIMVDIRCALRAGDYPVPDHLTNTIESMSSALRCLRYRDRKFGLFHGTQEGDVAAIDSILAQAGTHKRAQTGLKSMGYERLEQGRALLVMDTGKSPSAPFDKNAHASALAFEFCYAKERLIVSCGTHPVQAEWKDALRFTAAHSTACLDYRNSCEVKKDGHLGRKVTKASVKREDVKGASLLEASHDGYVPLNGITHGRKIYLADNGHDLRGEDVFTAECDPINPIEVAVRFHIHPSVTASLINDDQEILLRMPGGMGWRFKSSMGRIALEDSVYLGEGITPRKTKQIVVYTTITTERENVKWIMKKEG